jgi:hypothetical protein
MSLLSILIFLIVIGLVYYLINAFLPLPEPFKKIINIILICIVIVYLLKVLGVWAYLATVTL